MREMQRSRGGKKKSIYNKRKYKHEREARTRSSRGEDSVEARRAVLELEAAVAAEPLLEELGELAGGEAARERVPALLRGRVVRVVAVVVPLPELCGMGA